MVFLKISFKNDFSKKINQKGLIPFTSLLFLVIFIESVIFSEKNFFYKKFYKNDPRVPMTSYKTLRKQAFQKFSFINDYHTSYKTPQKNFLT